MAIGVQVWSPTPVNNATADSNINWAEGMAPSAVNDSARAMMASVAKWRDDNSGVLVTSGSSVALTVATNQVESALTTGFTFSATLGTSINGAATLAVDGLAATSIFTGLTTGTLVTSGQFAGGQICSFMFSTGVGPGNGWIIKSAPPVATPALQNLTNILSASVTAASTTPTDGPSITVNSTGIWFVNATLSFTATVGNPNFFCQLYDGATIFTQAASEVPAATGFNAVSLSAVVVSTASVIKAAAYVPSGGNSVTMMSSTGSATGAGSKLSYINAVRIG